MTIWHDVLEYDKVDIIGIRDVLGPPRMLGTCLAKRLERRQRGESWYVTANPAMAS